MAYAVVEVALVCHLVILFNRQILKILVNKQKLDRMLPDLRGFRKCLALSILQKVQIGKVEKAESEIFEVDFGDEVQELVQKHQTMLKH